VQHQEIGSSKHATLITFGCMTPTSCDRSTEERTPDDTTASPVSVLVQLRNTAWRYIIGGSDSLNKCSKTCRDSYTTRHLTGDWGGLISIYVGGRGGSEGIRQKFTKFGLSRTRRARAHTKFRTKTADKQCTSFSVTVMGNNPFSRLIFGFLALNGTNKKQNNIIYIWMLIF
jgi:hypothetical protein